MSDVISQLKALKTNPKAGWISEIARERSREILLSAIDSELLSSPSTSYKLQATSFISWQFFDLISKPLAAGAFVFVFLLGGWISTVNAASNSLPGDTLYTIKRVTEQAQLRLASLEDRAVLHTEFASRRLEEAAAMTQSGDPEKIDLVQITFDEAKQEIQLAQGDLKELSETGSSETVNVATVIDQKIDQLGEVSGLAEAAEAASDAVVDVLVETHDAAPQESRIDLQALFREQVEALQKRQTFDLGRVAMVRRVLAEHPELVNAAGLPTKKDLNVIEFNITDAASGVPSAMDRLTQGGSRDAFDAMNAMRDQLKLVESGLADIEVAITQAVAAITAPTEPLISEETLPSEISTVEVTP
jgi:hypothetical protein